MAHRSRKKSSALEMGPPDRPSPWRLTRRDVARRELCAAIEMFFNAGDPVVVHLLVAACEDICIPVARKAGRKPFRDEIDEMVKPEYLGSWRERQKAPYNFFKHGGADPDEVLPFFDPKMNDMKIFGATQDYLRAFQELPTSATVFVGWHMATYPALLTEFGQKMFGTILDEFSGMDETQRRAHARERCSQRQS